MKKEIKEKFRELELFDLNNSFKKLKIYNKPVDIDNIFKVYELEKDFTNDSFNNKIQIYDENISFWD
jgi:hypothetical protein